MYWGPIHAHPGLLNIHSIAFTLPLPGIVNFLFFFCKWNDERGAAAQKSTNDSQDEQSVDTGVGRKPHLNNIIQASAKKNWNRFSQWQKEQSSENIHNLNLYI